MPGFLYFVNTTHSTVTPEFAASLGLSHVAEKDESIQARACNGPDGRGLVFRFERPGDKSRLAYEPDKQTWVSCDGGKWWLGYQTDARPTPDDLVRKSAVGGSPVRLEDGDDWSVPVINALPAAFGIHDGRIDLLPADRFAGLRDDADRVFKRFLMDVAIQAGDGEDGEDITVMECFEIACRALAVNYRVSKWELSALRVLTTNNMFLVLGELIDIKAINEQARLKKNTDPDAPATNSGSVDSPRDTPQPTQTSTG